MSGYKFRCRCSACHSLTFNGSFVEVESTNEWLCNSCYSFFRRITFFEPDNDAAIEILKEGLRRKKRKI